MQTKKKLSRSTNGEWKINSKLPVYSRYYQREDEIRLLNELNKDSVKVIDWTGEVLYEGPIGDELDRALDANRCVCSEGCSKCNFTGYAGDISVEWLDSNDTRNVYEYINY